MTTTDMPPVPSPSPTGRRLLRRSRTDRVGAGVAGGLGSYFGLDPVLFRVLFATSAFFGGAGILAYLLAWAAIPEEGTEHAPVDGWIGELRRRRVPVWLVVVAGGLLLWALAFSWWAPGPLLPVAVIAIVLVIVFGRRDWQAAPPDAGPSTELVVLTKDGAAAPRTSQPWVAELRSWVDEARATHRARRRHALPVKIATLSVLVAALVALAVADAVTTVQIQTYCWTALAIVLGGLIVGVVLRRTPWSVSTLLVPIVLGALAFGGTAAHFDDGIGQQQWRPTGVPAAQYRLTFGQGVLDLRSLPPQSQPRTIHVLVGAGQVKVLAPSSLNLTVHVDVHIGQFRDTRYDKVFWQTDNGAFLDHTVEPDSRATGMPITVDVELSDGQVTVGTS